jgi:hypothetical protein
MLIHMKHDDLTIRLSTDQDGDEESIRRMLTLLARSRSEVRSRTA